MKYLNYLLEKKKKNEKITMLTAYDFPTARILEQAGIDAILTGDSYAMVKLGHTTTLPVTFEEMMTITKAVSRGIKESILIFDMPFLSYQCSEEKAVYYAGQALKETATQAVKIESLESNVSLIQKIVDTDIPVVGHIGLTPQSIYKFGGYKVQGKTAEEAKKIYHLAKQLELAGVSAVIMEGITSELAKKITEDLSIPTIGIGAGPYCDGQILVIDDLLGLNPEFMPKHVKKYADLSASISKAVLEYKNDVEKNKFPEKNNYSSMDEKEQQKLTDFLKD